MLLKMGVVKEGDIIVVKGREDEGKASIHR